MIKKIFFLIPLLFLGVLGKQETKALSSQDDCRPVKISCICVFGHKLLVAKELQASANNTSEQRLVECSGYPYRNDACASIKCHRFPNRIGEKGQNFITSEHVSSWVAPPRLHRHTYLSNSLYPPTITGVPGDLLEGHHLVVRRQINTEEGKPCQVKPVDSAVLKCSLWKDGIGGKKTITRCKIHCLHGYAFPVEGDFRSATVGVAVCTKNENVWKPFGLNDCTPYIHCNVEQVGPGYVVCTKPKDGPRYCHISCEASSGKEAVKLKKYPCLDENYSKTLPHCVNVETQERLISKPRVETTKGTPKHGSHASQSLQPSEHHHKRHGALHYRSNGAHRNKSHDSHHHSRLSAHHHKSHDSHHKEQ